MTITRDDALRQVPDGRLFVDGLWLEGSTGGERTHHDPATGEVVGKHQLAGSVEVDFAVKAARDALQRGELADPVRRRLLLSSLADAIVAAAGDLAALQTLEMGQPIRATRAGVALAAEWFRYFAGWADKLDGTVVPAGGAVLDYVVANPYGVVAAITPWNGPVVSIALKVAPAIAAGNAVVVKPSELAPFSALRFARICEEVVPPGVINVMPGGPGAGHALCAHPGVDKISFTGGSSAARAVARAAAENHTPVVLELGGKSASIVFADTEPTVVGKLGALLGTIQNSGQGCFLPTRLLVDRAIHDEVVAAVVATAEKARLGDPFEPSTTMGPLAGEAACERVLSVVEDARHRGDGVLLTGGQRAGGALAAGAFVQPTVFGDVDPASPLAQEEIFGPVLAVMPFDDEDEALAIANGTKYGLAGYVWTNDLRRAHRVAAALDAGYVSVNGMAALPPAAPFGGWRGSGHGVEGGRWGVHEFVRLKNVCVSLG
ncbi:MAG TPA: aldehyde dehydrogenase family protein [Acidimicrobiales bacterium]